MTSRGERSSSLHREPLTALERKAGNAQRDMETCDPLIGEARGLAIAFAGRAGFAAQRGAPGGDAKKRDEGPVGRAA